MRPVCDVDGCEEESWADGGPCPKHLITTLTEELGRAGREMALAQHSYNVALSRAEAAERGCDAALAGQAATVDALTLGRDFAHQAARHYTAIADAADCAMMPCRSINRAIANADPPIGSEPSARAQAVQRAWERLYSAHESCPRHEDCVSVSDMDAVLAEENAKAPPHTG